MTKLRRSQTGLGSLFIILVIVVVLGAGGLVAWKLTMKKPLTTSSISSSLSSATNAAVSSACLKQFNDSHLCAFAEHTNISSQQYEASGTTTTTSGTKSTFTIDNDGKGNTKVSYGSNSQTINAINLNGVEYVQEPGSSTWLAYSTGSSAISVPNPASSFNLNFATTTPAGVKVTKVGSVNCGGLSCTEYKVVEASRPTATQYVYFDNKDYLLRQWTSNDPSNGVSVDLTFSYKPITISKPSPVQTISTTP